MRDFWLRRKWRELELDWSRSWLLLLLSSGIHPNSKKIFSWGKEAPLARVLGLWKWWGLRHGFVEVGNLGVWDNYCCNDRGKAVCKR